MTHSATLPCRSNRPNAFGFFWPPMCGLPPLLAAYQATSPIVSGVAPYNHGVVVPARAAYSHSASVARRYALPVFADSQRQYSAAACHVMPSAGCLSLPKPHDSSAYGGVGLLTASAPVGVAPAAGGVRLANA